jgi:hypothetical protein
MKISDIPIMQVENMPKNEIWFGYIRNVKIDLPEIIYKCESEKWVLILSLKIYGEKPIIIYRCSEYAEDLFQIAGILGVNIYDFGSNNN